MASAYSKSSMASSPHLYSQHQEAWVEKHKPSTNAWLTYFPSNVTYPTASSWMQAVIRHPQICNHVYKRKQILKAPRSQRLLGHSPRVRRGPCAPGILVPLFSVAVFSYFEVINYFSSVHYFACVPVFTSFTYIHFAHH